MSRRFAALAAVALAVTPLVAAAQTPKPAITGTEAQIKKAHEHQQSVQASAAAKNAKSTVKTGATGEKPSNPGEKSHPAAKPSAKPSTKP